MATSLPNKRTFDPSPIPDRLYFKIGDVARICGVEPYVLRFWETQFPQLRPNKSGTGQRLYRRRDVELALEIKRLVHGEGYTIPGARQALAQGARAAESPSIQTEPQAAVADKSPVNLAAALNEIRTELREIAMILTAPELPIASAAVVTSALTQAHQVDPLVTEEQLTAITHHQPRRRHRRLHTETVEMGSLFPV